MLVFWSEEEACSLSRKAWEIYNNEWCKIQNSVLYSASFSVFFLSNLLVYTITSSSKQMPQFFGFPGFHNMLT